ncbi:MAG: carbon storage regulator [Candidatus Tumulicola sp.]
MLVLTRKLNQAIAIGDDIMVTVVGVDGDRVKLGIAAPPEFSIRRTGRVIPAAAPKVRRRSRT